MRLKTELGMARFGRVSFGGVRVGWRWWGWLALGLWPAKLLAATSGTPADSRFQPIDFSGVPAAISNLSSHLSSHSNWLPFTASFPTGTRIFHGVPFQLAGQLPVTGMDDARNGDFFPPRLRPIALGRKADRLHLALGLQHDDKVGVPVAEVVLHYASGAQRAFRLAYGVHALSWVKDRKEKRETLIDAESQMAWASVEEVDRSPSSVRLFQTVLDNPLPGEVISNAEWISMFSRCTPFLVGITLESAAGPVVARRPQVTPRVVRKSLQLSDRIYRDELKLQVRDARTGQPLTNATAALRLTDDEASFFFGNADADASGIARLVFPPQQTVGFDVLVRAPGYLPVVLSRTMINGTELPRNLEARLDVGTRIAGQVLDADGKPLAGARVNIHRVTAIGPKEYQRIDYDVALTGRDGRWLSESVPAGLTNFSFQVTHPGQRSALFVVADAESAKENVVSRESLLAGAAVMRLPPPLLITGKVTDPSGKPIAKADVRLAEPGGGEHAVPCDAEGRFSLMAEQPGEITLVAQAPGYATRVQNMQVEPGMSPVQFQFQLNKAQPFRGRVVDQYQAPVPGAKVRYEPPNGSRVYGWQTVADGQGRFVWESPPESDLMFYISATNYSSMRISFGGGGTGDHQIQLRRQSRVYGQVVDAQTGKWIDDFQVTRGRAYNYEEPIRWDRYDPIRGRKGEFSMRLDEYGSSGRSQILVEAPGYEPQSSPPYNKAGVYTNLFALKKGRGLSGMVEWSDGTPAPGVTVVLVDSGESVEMERSGELRRGNSGPAFQRSNGSGHFEFPPKFDAQTVLAAHERGYAQMSATNFLAGGKIRLQPWGRIHGVVRVGRKPEPGQAVMLQSARFNEEGRNSAALSLSLHVDPDANGNFLFDKVPAGDRSVGVQYKLSDRDSGRIAISHNTPVIVEAGQTAEVILGGTGRPIRGRVVPTGAEPEDLDWRRDVCTLNTMLSLPASVTPPMFTPAMDGEQRQQAMREYNERQTAFWRTPEGRKLQREQRTYVLLFDTNGAFRIENVDPGNYWLNVHITNPDRGMNYYETIGSQSYNVTIPPATGSSTGDPLDIGEFKVSIRGMMRLGRRAPPFVTQTFDGKPVKLADFKGKFVLLDFWASWTGTRTVDLRILKELYDTYGKDDRFVLLGLNFDQERDQAERVIKESGFKWLQCYAGPWNSTDLASTFGVQGLPEGVLVDPDGKIAARNLRGASMRTAVRNSLAAGRNPAPR